MTALARPWEPSCFTARSEQIAETASGVRMLVWRRQAPRGWMWRVSDGHGGDIEGRARTRAAAQDAAETAAETLA